MKAEVVIFTRLERHGGTILVPVRELAGRCASDWVGLDDVRFASACYLMRVCAASSTDWWMRVRIRNRCGIRSMIASTGLRRR